VAAAAVDIIVLVLGKQVVLVDLMLLLEMLQVVVDKEVLVVQVHQEHMEILVVVVLMVLPILVVVAVVLVVVVVVLLTLVVEMVELVFNYLLCSVIQHSKVWVETGVEME
jgi:hypothetical protein